MALFFASRDTWEYKSFTGVIVMLANGTQVYRSKVQKTVCVSITEAELVSICDAKIHLLLRHCLTEMRLRLD